VGLSTTVSYADFLADMFTGGSGSLLQIATETRNTMGAQSSVFGQGDAIIISAIITNPTGSDPYSDYYDYSDYYAYFDYYDYYDYYSYQDTTYIPYKVMVTITDFDNSPVFFKDLDTGVMSGTGHETVFDFQPKSLMPGTYTVHVQAWSEWLPEGVALAHMIGETTVEITGAS
jgi:hypothetical protein